MTIYFLNNEQEVIKVVPNDGATSIIQTQELPDDDSLLKDVLSVSLKNDERLFDAHYMAIRSFDENRNAFDMYRIVSEIVPDNTTEFEGVQIAPYELEGIVVEDARPVRRRVKQVAEQILQDSDWSVGYVEDNLPRVTTNFYYLSAKDSLKKLQEVANVEIQFKVEISGNKITDKWIEIYKQLGDRTLKRFNYGTNALTVKRETTSDELFTALIGRGKGEEVGETESGDATYGRKINFADVEWKKSNGKPVDKPKGQKFVELPSATAEYGMKLLDGRKVPRIGLVEFSEEEDEEALLEQTWAVLQEYARPKVLFSTTVANIGGTKIGDTVTIHRHELNMHYETRVRKVVRDRKNDDKTQVEIGDAVLNPSTKRQSNIDSKLNNLEGSLSNVETEVNYVLSTADGKNSSNYGNVEPERKREGDLWWRDHPSINGETQLLIWNGEAWVLEIDTSKTSENADRIAEQQQEIEEAKQTADEAVGQIDTAVANAGFTSLDETISSVQTISNQAQINAQTALNNSLNAIDDASLAKTNAQTAINKATELAGQVSDFELTVDGFEQTINDYEGQVSRFENKVTGFESTVASYETELDEYGNIVNQYATQVSTFENTVKGLSSEITSYQEDVEGYKSQVSSLENTVAGFNSTVKRVEANYGELGEVVNTHTTQISNMDGRISAKANQDTVDLIDGRVSSLGTEFDVVAGQISNKVWKTDIESAVDGLEIGGRNLLTNGNFENNLNDFRNWGTASRRDLVSVSDLPNLERALHIVGNGSGDSGLAKDNIDFVEGEKYTLSVWVYNNIQNTIHLQEGVRGINWRSKAFNVPTKKWTRISYTFEALSDEFGIYFGTKHGDIDALFTGVKLEKGTKATDWTPAPEDTDAKIEHIETEWTQTFDSFSQTVSSIDGRVTAQKQTLDSISSTVSGHGSRISTVEQTASGLQTTVADKANQSQVTQLANGLQSVVKDLDDLEVGGRNLLINSSFNSEVREATSGRNTVISRDNNRLEYTTSASVNAGYLFLTPENLKNGKEYTLSFTIESEENATFNYLYLRRGVGSTGYGDMGLKLPNQSISIGVNEIEITFKIPENHTNVNGLWLGSNNSVEKTFVLSNLKLEKGNIATDWTEAPEDVQSQITQLSDNINLRVTKGDVINQINISDENILIQANKIQALGDVVVDGKLTITDEFIAPNAQIDGAKIKDATIGSAKIIRVNAEQIVANSLSAISGNLGILSVGGQGNTSGAITMRDSNGNIFGSIDKSGLLMNSEIRLSSGYTWSQTGGGYVVSGERNVWLDFDRLRIEHDFPNPGGTIKDISILLGNGGLHMSTIHRGGQLPTNEWTTNEFYLGAYRGNIDKRDYGVTELNYGEGLIIKGKGNNASVELDGGTVSILNTSGSIVIQNTVGNVNIRAGNKTYVESDLLPWSNGDYQVGNTTYRWNRVYVTRSESVSSDGRLKNGIQHIPDRLIELLAEYLQPKMYHMYGKWHFGYVAQDARRALRVYARERVSEDRVDKYVEQFDFLQNDEYLSLVYAEIAVLKDREQQIKMEKLEKRIEELENAS